MKDTVITFHEFKNRILDKDDDEDDEEYSFAAGFKVIMTVVMSDNVEWTTNKMYEELDESVSKNSIRSIFNDMSDVKVMKHEKGSQYWYPLPQVFG